MFLLIITSLLISSILSQSLPFFSSHYLTLVLDLHQHHCRVSKTKTELESGGQSLVQKHGQSMVETCKPIIITSSRCQILTTNYQTPASYVMDIVQGTNHQVPTNSIVDWVLTTNHSSPLVTLKCSRSDGYGALLLALGHSYNLAFHLSAVRGHVPILSP